MLYLKNEQRGKSKSNNSGIIPSHQKTNLPICSVGGGSFPDVEWQQMGRNIKQGIDYFPHDTNLSDDVKIELLEAEHGLLGYAIYLKLLEKIYRSGYHIEFSETTKKIFCRKVLNINISDFDLIFQTLLKENLFNKKLYDKYKILTSESIQIRFFFSIKKRKKIKVDERFLIYSPETDINVELIPIYSPETPIYSPESTHSKVKESKGKKRKEKYIEIAEIIIGYLNLKTNKKFKYVDSNFKELIARQKDGYTEEQFKFIIDNKLKDKYFIENTKYYNPDTLFRKSNIEKYLNETFDNIKKYDPNPNMATEEMYRAEAEYYEKLNKEGE